MSEKILIIDDDIDTLKLVGLMLQKQGYQIVAANNGPDGLARAFSEAPDIILLDVMMPDMDGYEVARRLRADPRTAATPILMFTAKSQLDDKVQGFEAGADDYLTKPTHPAELLAHVRALLARVKKAKGTAPLASQKRAFTIGVMAARGGLGVTTVALNLADHLHQLTKQDVILAELRPGMGTLAFDLGISETDTLRTLLQTNLNTLAIQELKQKLFTHDTGLQILCGTTRPRDAALLQTIPPFESLVNRLSYAAPYLVLDLGAGLTALAQKLLPLCNLLVLVVEPVRNSVLHSRMFLSELNALGIPLQENDIVPVMVSRARSDTNLTLQQVEQELGRPVLVNVTPAPELVHMAVRMQMPFSRLDAKSLTAQQFTKMASAVLELERKKSEKKT